MYTVCPLLSIGREALEPCSENCAWYIDGCAFIPKASDKIIMELGNALTKATVRALEKASHLMKATGEGDMNRGQFISLAIMSLESAKQIVSKDKKDCLDEWIQYIKDTADKVSHIKL